MSKNNSITIITPFYYPEDTAIGLYTTQFAEYLSKNGFKVKIITGFPNYPQWKIHSKYTYYSKFYSEKIEDIEIYRYKQYIPKKVDFKGRVLMMIDLCFGTLLNLRKIKKTDLVLCIVPFTISIIPALILAKVKKANLWIHIQDFEFDLALDTGVIKNNFILNILKKYIFRLEKKLLNSGTIVSSISFSMMNKIKDKAVKSETYLFPNWVSSKKINPESSYKHPEIDNLKFTLLYSGNIGEKQDWKFLESLCNLINPSDNIEIIIVGDGGFKQRLIQQISQHSFVKFLNPVPYKDLNNLLCSVDIHFLFQKTEIVDTIMPSKILGMMASQKPSIVTGNKNSEVFEIFKKSEGGFYFSENDPLLVYNQILKLKNNPSLIDEIGLKARNFILNNFSDEYILENFMNKIKSLK